MQSLAANSSKPQSQIRLECVRSNLIAVIGYELWNPLSTIQVCLESLANEPTMPPKSKQLILDTAVEDIQNLHQLVEHCLTFSEIDINLDSQTTKCGLIHSPATLQQILHDTILRISALHSVESDSELMAKFISRAVKQDIVLSEMPEEVLKHVRQNLIAIVGHEIRTPLCTIEVCLESLSDESQASSEYCRKMLDIALNDLERLQKLIKDFFLLERLEKGQVYHRPKYVLVRDAIDLALESLKTRSNSDFVPNIVVEIPSHLPLVKVDEDSLVEALIKLLDNACKFTSPQGEIKIQAQIIKSQTDSTPDRSCPNIMLEIAISDNGRGIVPHNLEAIFSCFYQEEDFLRRTVNGTGIGLTICRHLISGLGGKIWANSAGKNLGSSIHFTLPLVVTT